MLNLNRKLFLVIGLSLITVTSNAMINLGTSVESDKDILVGDPVYMRNGVIELTFYLKRKDGGYSTLVDRDVDLFTNKVVAVRKKQWNIFQKVLTVNCNEMTAKEISKTWWNNEKIVLNRQLSNPIGEAELRKRGVLSSPIMLNPGSDEHKAAMYQCENAIPLKQYGY